jgi:ELWxxDGT repeat protein
MMKHYRLRFVLLIAMLCGPLMMQAARADAQGPPPFTLVKDISTTAQPADSMGGDPMFITLGDQLLFSGATRETGGELWRTDGTEAGTQLVKDINPGAGWSLNYYGTPTLIQENTLLFAADNGATGYELWRSDGTSAGTTLVKDTWPGVEGGYPGDFRTVGNRAFFSAQSFESRQALWITDGTPQGTIQLKSFTHLHSFVLQNNLSFFSASENGNNIELWKSDGTPQGTVRVKDINPGAEGSNPVHLMAFRADLVLFSADDGVNGEELWRSDGTDQGTHPVKNIHATGSSSPNDLVPIELTFDIPGAYDAALFSADDGTTGRELWITDGFKTTELVTDTYKGLDSSEPFLLAMNTCRCATYTRTCPFFAMTDKDHGRELWIADGERGMVLLKDINPGQENSSINTLVRSGDTFYFSATDADSGAELWKTNGTPQGTQRVADIHAGKQPSNPYDLTAFDGKLYFTANDGARGRELWTTDGTPQGTALLKDIGPDKDTGVEQVLGVAFGALYFTADDGATGLELWKTDGTSQGTVQVKNIAPDEGGLYGYSDYYMTALGDKLMFGLERESGGVIEPAADSPSASLWISDGTPVGTREIQSFPGSDEGSAPSNLTTLGDGVLFYGINKGGVRELWRSDGTLGGADILTNTVKSAFGYINSLTRLNDLAIFSVITDTTSDFNTHHASLWKSDGTPQGTQPITFDLDIYSSSDAVSGDTLFFAGNPSSDNNVELWKSDGTAAGTQLVKDIRNGAAGSYPRTITPGAPGSVFFTARVDDSGYALWKSDGTAAGTRQVYDVFSADNIYEYNEMVSIDGTLFFTANDGVYGWELWKSDGTGAGTQMLADIYPNAGSSAPHNLIDWNGALYFSATGPDGRRTLWRSDGSAVGTQPVRVDANTPLNPENITVVHNQLMFSAADAAHGRELWKSDGTAAGTMLYQDFHLGAGNSNPNVFIEAAQNVFLTAETPGIGRGLWARTPNNAPAPGSRTIYLPLTRR